MSSVSRSALLKLLTEACELEHGLACSYLYSAMTLRQEPDGKKFSPAQALQARQWASQVYFVASQEMLHLAQAWNLLTALGGTPYYLRPNFPQNTKYYPLHVRLELEPYGESALNRFIAYEKPVELLRAEDRSEFNTIGELYNQIEAGIAALPNAIIGDAAAQIGPDLIDFPDIIRVVDTDSAHRAIHLVTHQGEGNQTDRADCHFGIFIALKKEFLLAKELNPEFSPAYPSIKNPTSDTSPQYGAPHATLIRNPQTKEIATVFDGLYSLMMRMLGYTFTQSGDLALRRVFGQTAIVMMVSVIKPLGEALARMPATDKLNGCTAGPPFGLTRHVILPADSNVAHFVVTERLAELTAALTRLAVLPSAPDILVRVESALRRLPSLNVSISF